MALGKPCEHGAIAPCSPGFSSGNAFLSHFTYSFPLFVCFLAAESRAVSQELAEQLARVQHEARELAEAKLDLGASEPPWREALSWRCFRVYQTLVRQDGRLIWNCDRSTFDCEKCNGFFLARIFDCDSLNVLLVVFLLIHPPTSRARDFPRLSCSYAATLATNLT
eukprot:889752-Pleurochrysis_carterae.AAC.1